MFFDSALQIAELSRHPEGSPGWNVAVLNLLLEMKEKGININELTADGVSDVGTAVRTEGSHS